MFFMDSMGAAQRAPSPSLQAPRQVPLPPAGMLFDLTMGSLISGCIYLLCYYIMRVLGFWGATKKQACGVFKGMSMVLRGTHALCARNISLKRKETYVRHMTPKPIPGTSLFECPMAIQTAGLPAALGVEKVFRPNGCPQTQKSTPTILPSKM